MESLPRGSGRTALGFQVNGRLGTPDGEPGPVFAGGAGLCIGVQPWKARDCLAVTPGDLAPRLHWGLGQGADFNDVNVGRSAIAAAVRAAVGDPACRAHAPVPDRPRQRRKAMVPTSPVAHSSHKVGCPCCSLR